MIGEELIMVGAVRRQKLWRSIHQPGDHVGILVHVRFLSDVYGSMLAAITDIETNNLSWMLRLLRLMSCR